MKTEYGIIIVAGFLIFAIFGMIFFAPDDVPIHTEISKINQQGILAQEANDKEKLEEYGSLMQEKITEIARNSLGLNIFMSGVFQGYFPIADISKVEIPKGKELFQICDVAENIPIHLQNIGKTEKFQMFAKKYSEYPRVVFTR